MYDYYWVTASTQNFPLSWAVEVGRLVQPWANHQERHFQKSLKAMWNTTLRLSSLSLLIFITGITTLAYFAGVFRDLINVYKALRDPPAENLIYCRYKMLLLKKCANGMKVSRLLGKKPSMLFLKNMHHDWEVKVIVCHIFHFSADRITNSR